MFIGYKLGKGQYVKSAFTDIFKIKLRVHKMEALSGEDTCDVAKALL